MLFSSFKSLGQILRSLEKKSTSFTKVVQDSGEAFTDFFFKQRVISTVNKGLSDPDSRQVLMEILHLKMLNTECKNITRPSKVRAVPVVEWIRDSTMLI